MLFVTCETKNNLRWSGRPRTGCMYLSRAILTSSLWHWKFLGIEKFSCIYSTTVILIQVLPIVYWCYVSPTQPSLHLLWRCLMSSQSCGRARRLGVALPQASTTMHTPHWVRFIQVSSLRETWTTDLKRSTHKLRPLWDVHVWLAAH